MRPNLALTFCRFADVTSEYERKLVRGGVNRRLFEEVRPMLLLLWWHWDWFWCLCVYVCVCVCVCVG